MVSHMQACALQMHECRSCACFCALCFCACIAKQMQSMRMQSKTDAKHVQALQNRCNMSLLWPLSRFSQFDDHLWRWRWRRWQHLHCVLHQLSGACTLRSNIATHLCCMLCLLLLHAHHQAQCVVGQVQRRIWADLSAHGAHHRHRRNC